MTAVVAQVGLINATGDLRAMGLDAEADLLQRAFAFLLLYGTTSTLFERLANDPTALERYNESLAGRLGDSAPDCVDAGDGVPVASAYYALPNSPPSDCFPVSSLPAAPKPVK